MDATPAHGVIELGTGTFRGTGRIVPGLRAWQARMMVPRRAALPAAPREVEPFTYPDGIIKILDQDGKGACNGFAAAASLMWARWIAGYTHVDLSPWFVYAILCNGVDQGSMISDALDLLTQTGTCPDSVVPYATINPRSLSQAARDAAGRFKIDLGGPLRNFDDMVAATVARRPFNFSIFVGNNFNSLDADGCPPAYPGQPGNHAVCGGLGIKAGRDGRPRIKVANSWSTAWGLNGYFWVAAAHVDRQPYFEAYDVIGPTIDPADPDRPVPVRRK